MKAALERGQNRREFLTACARGAALGGLGLIGAVLSQRKGQSPAIGGTCVSRGVCRRCPAYEDCGLPQALSAKSRGMQAEK